MTTIWVHYFLPNALDSSLLIIRGENDMFALANANGEFLTQHIFSYVEKSGNYLSVYCDSSEKRITFLENKASMVDFKFNFGTPSHCGLISNNGKWVILPKYSSIQHWQKDLYIVQKDSKFGVVNSRDETMIPINYDYLEQGRVHNFLVCKSDGKHGLIDLEQKLIVKPKYNYIGEFADSDKFTFYFEDAKKSGYLDEKGKKVLEIEAKSLRYFHAQKFIAFVKDNKKGIANEQGKIIFQPMFDDVVDLYNFDGFIFKDNDKAGLGSMNGKILIPAIYENFWVNITNQNDRFIVAILGTNYDIFDENFKKIANFKTFMPSVTDSKPILQISADGKSYILNKSSGMFERKDF